MKIQYMYVYMYIMCEKKQEDEEEVREARGIEGRIIRDGNGKIEFWWVDRSFQTWTLSRHA